MKLRKIFSNFLFVNAFFVVYTSDVATASPLDATKLNISPLFAFLMINLLMAIVPPFTAFIIKINQARDKLSSLQYCRGTKRYDVLLISGARVRIFVDRCSTIQNAGAVLYFLPKRISAILQTDSMEKPLWKNMGMTLSTMRF